jgi:hypothetical protein
MMTVETKVAKPIQTCSEFQDNLAELAASGVDFHDDEHLSTCENCAALVDDLQEIVKAAKLLLPLRDPSPVVWEKISKQISEEKTS